VLSDPGLVTVVKCQTKILDKLIVTQLINKFPHFVET